MATKAKPVSPDNNRVYHYRLLTLTIDEGTSIVRNIFEGRRPNVPLQEFIETHRGIFQRLMYSGFLTRSQYDLLFPVHGKPNTENFDLDLIICLLGKCLQTDQFFPFHTYHTEEKTLEGDLYHLHMIGKDLLHIPSTKSISRTEFEMKCRDIETNLVRLNAKLDNPDVNLQQRIDECKTISLDHEPIEKIEQRVEHVQALTPSEGSEKEWTSCIENKDKEKGNQLLEQGQLPEAALFDKACQTFGLKSPLLKKMCTQIEEKITASSDCIIYTDACYKETEKDKVVFVIITRRATDYLDWSNVKYNVLVRSIDYCSQEGRMVADKETGLRFEDSEIEALEKVLKENSPDLMRNHSNLTLTSGSMFKSKYQGTIETSVERKVSIVLYVTVKGLIPVGENLFPKRLGQFDTDVREGRLFLADGGPPEAKHENLKLGCRISCMDKTGTIGGFVDHKTHGVCALTCAHVVFSTNESDRAKTTNDIDKKCFQPDFIENGIDYCGEIAEVKMKDENLDDAGVDAALVKICDKRFPTDGSFPDCDLNSPCKGEVHKTTQSYNNGKVLDTDKISTANKVIKYGQKTRFTEGKLNVKGGAGRFIPRKVREDIQLTKNKTLTLCNLLEIQKHCCNFCAPGDSGALVFSQDANNELAAFGLLVGYAEMNSITLVEPICHVLKHVGFKEPFSFKTFDQTKNLYKRCRIL